MALADMPLPLLCMRPIFAELFGKTVAVSDDQRGILVGNTKDKRGGFATLGRGGVPVRSRFGTDLTDFTSNCSTLPTADLYMHDLLSIWILESAEGLKDLTNNHRMKFLTSPMLQVRGGQSARRITEETGCLTRSHILRNTILYQFLVLLRLLMRI